MPSTGAGVPSTASLLAGFRPSSLVGTTPVLVISVVPCGNVWSSVTVNVYGGLTVTPGPTVGIAGQVIRPPLAVQLVGMHPTNVVCAGTGSLMVTLVAVP